MQNLLSKSTSALAVALLLFVTVPVAARPSCDQIEPVDVLPEDAVCAGWVRDGEPGEAHTVQELTVFVDGEAFVYAQYGFVAAAFQSYSGEVAGELASADLRLFNQGNPQNAEELFNDPGIAVGSPVDDWPWSGAARKQSQFSFVVYQFWHECFYGYIILSPAGEDGFPIARCLAEQTCSRIEGVVPVQGDTWGGIKAGFR